MLREDREIRRKMRIFEYAEETGNIRKTCRHFGIPRSLFYVWKGKYELEGEAGLARKKPQWTHPASIKPEIVEKVLHLRRTYHLGPIRIVWYLERAVAQQA